MKNYENSTIDLHAVLFEVKGTSLKSTICKIIALLNVRVFRRLARVVWVFPPFRTIAFLRLSDYMLPAPFVLPERNDFSNVQDTGRLVYRTL